MLVSKSGIESRKLLLWENRLEVLGAARASVLPSRVMGLNTRINQIKDKVFAGTEKRNFEEQLC